MTRQLILLIVLATTSCLPCYGLFGQSTVTPAETRNNLRLLKKKKAVDIFRDDYIGLTTATDTIKYFGEKFHSYKIVRIDSFGFSLRRPQIYKDTIVATNRLSTLNGREYLYGKANWTRKQWYASIVLVESYEYKTVPLSEITSIQYPPDAGNTMGCFSCAIIPIYNIFYFRKMRKRWHPENFEIGKWRMEVFTAH